MDKHDWKINIREVNYSMDREVFIYRNIGDFIEVANFESKTFTKYERGSAIPETPSLVMSPEMLQAFADALNNTGYKPQKGFVEGELQATKVHLDDMRKLLKVKE